MTAEERVKAIAAFGFTERQARFLVTVMRCAGICVPRQYATFAGIANGGQKANAFFDKLIRRGFASACDCVHNRARLYRVHHRSLYHAIGESGNRYRRPVSPRRAVERLMLLDALLTSSGLDWPTNDWENLDHVRTRTGEETVGVPAVTGVAQSRGRSNPFADTCRVGLHTDGRAVVLYLATVPWPDEFRRFIDAKAQLLRTCESTLRLAFPCPVDRAHPLYLKVIRDQMDPQLHRVEVVVLVHNYRHLFPVASLIRPKVRGVEDGERRGERVPAHPQPNPPPPPSTSPTITEQLERDWYRFVGRA